MNIKHIIASVSLLAAVTGAFAGSDISSSDQVLTRQQVYKELLRARAAGELNYSDATYPLAPREVASKVTREEVLAELYRARAAGEMNYTDATYPLSLTAAPTLLTRESVRAEAIRARAAGELDYTEASYPFTLSSSNPLSAVNN
ncbi:MAG: DUF4148 domain-containing protein [Pseudomonadota bacterium]